MLVCWLVAGLAGMAGAQLPLQNPSAPSWTVRLTTASAVWTPAGAFNYTTTSAGRTPALDSPVFHLAAGEFDLRFTVSGVTGR